MWKKGKRKTLLTQFSIVMVSAISLIACSFAWFYNGKTVDNSQISITASEATGFRISTDGSSYSIVTSLAIPQNVELVPVSGDGQNFYMPKLPVGSDDANSATTWAAITYDSTADMNYFFKQTIYLQAISPGYIMLDSLSLVPYATYENTSLQSTNKADISRPVVNSLYRTYDYSNTYYSKDYIAAAARVYFKTQQSTNDLLYIPLDKYQIDLTKGTNDVYSISINSNAADIDLSNYRYYDGSMVSSYSLMSGVNIYRDSQINYTLPVTELTVVNTDTGLYETTFDIYFWIEGFDNEAVSAFAGGQFHVDIKLSFSKTAN